MNIDILEIDYNKTKKPWDFSQGSSDSFSSAGAVKKSTPKQEEEISIEDIPF